VASSDELRLPPHMLLPPPLLLAPAANRDVIAEVMTAASVIAEQQIMDQAPQVKDVKPLRKATVRGAEGQQDLIGEEIDAITTGRHAGMTWLRPVAFRDAGESWTLFPLGIESAFVPTERLAPLEELERVSLRLLREAHELELEEAAEAGPHRMRLHSFFALLSQQAEPDGPA